LNTLSDKSQFNVACRDCPRLAGFLDQVKAENKDYWCKPVPPFGDSTAKLLIVGLAPGMHGANATGRPFTGDYAGILLYQTLYDTGFSNQPLSESSDDTLKLENCRITNAVKCLPPGNKPTTEEIRCCNKYLYKELKALPDNSIILALGKIAHDAVLRAFRHKISRFPFGHGTQYALPEGPKLLSSYHCSRYNTQTKRLTPEMFIEILQTARAMLDSKA